MAHIDSTTTVITYGKKGDPYLPGVPSMTEDAVTQEFAAWWTSSYSVDFSPFDSLRTQVGYPNLPRARCDLVFTTDGLADVPEWALEVKRIQQVGDNGKGNDYGVAKMLSPYLKDRSLKHDVIRQRDHSFARRHGVLGYGFSYDLETCEEAARLHPDKPEHIKNVRDVLRKNDPSGLSLDTMEIVDAVNTIFVSEGLVVSDVVTVPTGGLYRHPCGGKGVVFAWEVRLRD